MAEIINVYCQHTPLNTVDQNNKTRDINFVVTSFIFSCEFFLSLKKKLYRLAELFFNLLFSELSVSILHTKAKQINIRVNFNNKTD